VLTVSASLLALIIGCGGPAPAEQAPPSAKAPERAHRAQRSSSSKQGYDRVGSPPITR
jgi:hypothetical protein